MNLRVIGSLALAALALAGLPCQPGKSGRFALPAGHFSLYRRFGAKPDKKVVDGQAAMPSSWKTPCIAERRTW